MFDDGNGPALFAGGCIPAQMVTIPPWPGQIAGIAKWDGIQWRPLGLGVWIFRITGSPVNGVWAMAPFDPDGPDGPIPSALYAGGNFFWLDGEYASNFGAWLGCSGTPPCGDANGDGIVNEADLDLALQHYNLPVSPGTAGDVDGDGFITQADLDIILFGFGRECG